MYFVGVALEQHLRDSCCTTEITVILDKKGFYKYVSPAATKLCGYSTEEILGEKPEEFIHPDDLPIINDALEKAVKTPGQSIQTPDIRMRCKDGGWIIISGFFNNMIQIPGVEGFVGNYRDVTEKKRAEEEKRHLEEQIQHTQKLESLNPYTAFKFFKIMTSCDR